MSLLDLDLSEYDIYNDELEKYKDCANLVKFAFSVANKNETKGERNRKAKRLKEILKQLKEEWFCEYCNKQSFSQRGYNTHVGSTEHIAKYKGEELTICPNRKCRKKCIGKEGLEQHLSTNSMCLEGSPKNQSLIRLNMQKQIWEQEKDLFRKKSNPNHKWTEEDKFNYNRMMRKHQSQNPEGWGELKMNQMGLLETQCVAEEPEQPTNFYNTIRLKTDEELEYEREKEKQKWEYEIALSAARDWDREQQRMAEADERERLFNEINEIKVV